MLRVPADVDGCGRWRGCDPAPRVAGPARSGHKAHGWLDQHYSTRVISLSLDADHDVADLLPGLDIPVGLDDLLELVPPVDDGLELPGLDDSLDVGQPTRVAPREGEHDLLAAEQRGDERQHRVLGQGAEVGREVDPARLQLSLAAPERALADRIEDHVVGLLVRGEVLGRVVDDPVGTQAPDQRPVLGVADRGHLGTETLHELDR